MIAAVESTAPAIVITPGEPAGIGPDLVLMLAQQQWPCRLAVIADPGLLRERAKRLSLPVTIEDYRGQAHRPGRLAVEPEPISVSSQCGKLDPANSGYVLKTLDRAVRGCMQNKFAALVTGPVHKGIINDAGITFTGHTEFLAQHTSADCPVMVLVAGDLRVALATTHVPLKEVHAHINHARLKAVIEVLLQEAGWLCDSSSPRIAVCGLNPHAGEGGHLGREEIEIIAPLIEHFRQQGNKIKGPFAADTIFTPMQRAQYDLVLTMYHDQGLPALKALGFGHAVNVTLGLPIIRTSVDHGTALDMAGSGHADTGSLSEAISLALKLARRRSRTS